MRIAFDAKRLYNNPTGLGNYARSLLTQLVQQFPQHQYHLYTPMVKMFDIFLSSASNVKKVMPTTSFSKAMPALWRSQGIIKDLLANETQIYHGLSNELPNGIENTNIKTVVTIHDLIFLHYPQNYPWFDRQIYQKKFKSSSQRANIIIATSEQTKQDLVHFYGTDPNKITVIYQDCDVAFNHIYTPSDKAVLIKKYNLSKQFILCVGTLEKRKNQLGLVKAFKLAKLPDITLVLVGKNGDAADEIMETIDANKLHDRVIVLNDVDRTELPVLYQMAHLFVYPSFYEGFGIPVLEALKSKVPVVTSSVSSLPEVAGNAAILVDPTNINALKDGLEKGCFDVALRKVLLNNAELRINQFDTTVLTKQVMDVYQKLI